MLTVLIPHPIPERCYLSEAVLWVAINRIPWSLMTENNIESREDYDYVDDMEPYVPDPIVSVEECEQLGLEPNPFWENIDSGYPARAFLENLLRSEKDENRRRELKKDLSESRDFGNVRRNGMRTLKSLSTYVGTSCFCPLPRGASER